MTGTASRTDRIAWLLAGICICGALLEVGRMFRYLVRSVTNVFWVDQWIMLEELWRFHDGRYPLSYLWAPYWGHRIPVPRLIFLLDERWFHFSNVPLVALNLTMQCCLIAILSATQWKLLSSKSRPLAAAMISITFYLLFSGLQMENFVYGMSVQYGIGYASAIAAIFLGSGATRLSFGIAAACALISTLTIAAGLMLWPLLAMEIYLLKGSRLRIFFLLATGAALAVIYAIGYSQPGIGMGVSGMLSHPLQAAVIASMFLGGPVSLASLLGGQVSGLLGILTSLYLLWRCFVRGRQARPEFIILAITISWLVCISFSIPFARMQPNWIASFHGSAPLPSRYFTPSFLFWCCLTAALLSICATRIASAICLLAIGSVLFCTLTRESAYLNDWLTFCQRLDATASGFMIGAEDQEYMARSYPDQNLLNHWIPYARQHRLSIFAEPRAAWINGNAANIVKTKDTVICQLTMDHPSKAGPAIKLTGKVEGAFQVLARQEDLLFANSAGTVIGLGRTFIDTHDHGDRRKLIGYAKGNFQEITAVYLIDARRSARACLTYFSKIEHIDQSDNRNIPR